MSKQMFIFTLLFCLFCGTASGNAHLPSFIKPCHMDSSLNQCALERANEILSEFVHGIPDLDVEPLDPLHMKNNIEVKGNGLDLILKDVDIHGLGKSKVKVLDIDVKNEKFELVFIVPIKVTADYNINGTVLHIPITGDGKATIDGYNVKIKFTGKLAHPKTSKGEFLKLVSTDYTYDIEKTVFRFTNLYNGNQKLSDIIHKVVNENWKAIMDELAPAPIKQLMTAGMGAINKFFETIDVHDLVEGYNLQK